MKTVGEIRNAMVEANIISKFEKFADHPNMTIDQAINELAGDWMGEEDGLFRSVLEGDLEAMLDEDIAAWNEVA